MTSDADGQAPGSSGDETPGLRRNHPAGATLEERRSLLLRTQDLPATGTHLAAFLVRERSRASRVGYVLLATGAASAGSVLLGPSVRPVPFVLLWPAVLFSALIGGLWGAALSSVLAVLVVDTFILEPVGTIGLNSRDLVPLGLFLLAALAMSSVANALRTARNRAADATHELHTLAVELDEQAIELEQQLEESQALQEELQQTGAELAERTADAERADAFSRGILASITDPMVVFDADWHFVFINDQADVMLRRLAHGDHESLLGQRVWDALPMFAATEHERQMRRAVAERVPVTYDTHDAESGRWFVLSCYPLPDGGLATQWRDVTGRRRAEEAARYLARASELLGASLDYETTLRELAQVVVPNLAEWCTVHMLDEAGGVHIVARAHADPAKVEWSRQHEDRYPGGVKAGPDLEAVLHGGPPFLLAEITDEMLVARSQDAEHLALLRALELRSMIVVPLSAGGVVLGAMSLYSGRTGRRYGQADVDLAMELARRAALAVENALLHRAERQARLAADEANKVKMQFLATMSHELRTPLNAIGGYAELLRMGLRGPVTEAQVQDLERIAHSQRSLLGLINDILNFAKVEAGHVEFHVADVPVLPLLRDLESLVAPQLLAGGLTLAGAECDDRLAVRADEEKFRQIVLNLLTNAIKFTPAGGAIRVRCAQAGSTVRVAVIDTGIGVASDRLESVFDPFVQLDRTLTSQHEGTGLGLSISRDLARAMGGDIEAASAPGEGSTFTVVLPTAVRG